jgi:hypothetical protein
MRVTLARNRPGIPRTALTRKIHDTMSRVQPMRVVLAPRPPPRPRSLWLFHSHIEEVDVEACLRADYRVEDTTIEGYESYLGTDAAPDFDAAPWETFTTLPHESAALAAGHDYQLVIRRRNRFGLLSLNISPTMIGVDAGGAETATKPSAPTTVSVSPAAAGAVQVAAAYNYTADGTDAATIWAIWITDDGSDPDPDNDVATATETMVQVSGVSILDYTSGVYADAATIKVTVRTRRVDTGPVNVDSDNTDIHTTTADTDGPTAPDPDIFHGDMAEEAQ